MDIAAVKKQSTLEREMAFMLRVAGVEVVPEFRFHPDRKWRFDFSIPEKKIAIECEGGTWTGGRHVRGSGFEKDCEKYNAAAALNWRVFRYTKQMIASGEAVNQIKEVLGEED